MFSGISVGEEEPVKRRGQSALRNKKKSETRAKEIRAQRAEESLRHHLRELENDNYGMRHDVSHLSDDDEVMSVEPKRMVGGRKKRKKNITHKQRVPKSFRSMLNNAHLENVPPEEPTYITVEAAPSKYPPHHLCTICGFEANYSCVSCGRRYCSVSCQKSHKDLAMQGCDP